MGARVYEIEITFTTGGAYRLKRYFTTQKDARAWCGRVGMSPIFGGARPCMFWSSEGIDGRHGMQATIYERGARFWLDSSTEGRARARILRAYR